IEPVSRSAAPKSSLLQRGPAMLKNTLAANVACGAVAWERDIESPQISSRPRTAKSIFGNERVPPRAGIADDFDRFATRLHVVAPCRRKPADRARNRVGISRQGASFYYPACALRPRR